MDFAWVSLRLKDVNDNPPLFARPHAHVTVSEDATPGTQLVSMPARDPDAVSEFRGRVEGEALQIIPSFKNACEISSN